MPSIQFEVLDWSAAREAASAVRRTVFVVEQGVPEDVEWDPWDARSLHCLAADKAGHVRGTGRLLPDDDLGTARIGRMAVLREWRRHGIGGGILDILMKAASQRGTRRIELHAQVHAAAFYRRYGFSQTGDIFEEAGIPHITMVKTLEPVR